MDVRDAEGIGRWLDGRRTRSSEIINQNFDLRLVFLVYQFEIVMKRGGQSGSDKVRLRKIVQSLCEESVLEIFLTYN